jgi:tellurite resistance protein TerA
MGGLMELKQKGSDAKIGAFKQLKVSLIWTSAVDLDLMAFYKTKDRHTGGVYSDNYAGGSLGDLNQFPFIQLSGDEGVGAVGGENQEDVRINVNKTQRNEPSINQFV